MSKKQSPRSAQKPSATVDQKPKHLDAGALAELLATGSVTHADQFDDRPYTIVLRDRVGQEIGYCDHDTTNVALIEAAMKATEEQGKAAAAAIIADMRGFTRPEAPAKPAEDGRRKSVAYTVRTGGGFVDRYTIGEKGVKAVDDRWIDKGNIFITYEDGSEEKIYGHAVTKSVKMAGADAVQTAKEARFPDANRNLLGEFELLRTGQGLALEVVWENGEIAKICRADRIYQGPCLTDGDVFVQIVDGTPVALFSAKEMIVVPYSKI